MTRARPRVSVGIPVYNGERYLAAALESLRAQTYEDFELIISDNASIDHTAEIARSYAAQDRRIRYVRNARNVGAAGNFRHTLQLASGEYFRWAAADDISAPEFLARCVEVLDREPRVVLAYPKTRFIDEYGRVTADYDDRLHLPQQRASDRFRALVDRLGHCNAMYGLTRKDVVRRTRLLGSYFGADIVLLAELVLYGARGPGTDLLLHLATSLGARPLRTARPARCRRETARCHCSGADGSLAPPAPESGDNRRGAPAHGRNLPPGGALLGERVCGGIKRTSHASSAIRSITATPEPCCLKAAHIS